MQIGEIVIKMLNRESVMNSEDIIRCELIKKVIVHTLQKDGFDEDVKLYNVDIQYDVATMNIQYCVVLLLRDEGLPEKKYYYYLKDKIHKEVLQFVHETYRGYHFSQISVEIIEEIDRYVCCDNIVNEVPLNNVEERRIEMFNVDNAVKEIIHQNTKKGEHFTVVWDDDTKTTVRLMEGDTSDEYVAFLFALGKKIFENKGNGRAFVREKKAIFEDRIAQNRRQKEVQRRIAECQQCCEDDDFCDGVCDTMFVTPIMLSRGMFKKNQ